MHSSPRPTSARADLKVVVLERLDHLGGQPYRSGHGRGRRPPLAVLVPREPAPPADHRRPRAATRAASPALTRPIRPIRRAPERGILVDTADAAATAAFLRPDHGRPARVVAVRGAAGEARSGSARAVPDGDRSADAPPASLDERLADDTLWDDLVERPLGGLLRSSLSTDLVARHRAHRRPHRHLLIGGRSDTGRQNRCFLYHVIGGGTGDWDVPIGGMGGHRRARARRPRRGSRSCAPTPR